MTLDLFAATQARDEAIEVADASVSKSVGGDALVARVIARLVDAYPVGTRFTADVLALYLDDEGVERDQSTRRRITSTIINRGRGKLWVAQGYTVSEDARRKARPVALWERTP